MNHALVFLLTRSFWNAIVYRVQRLRQPKYLFGALFGSLYILLNFGRLFFFGYGQGHRPPVPALPGTELGPQIGALFLLGAVLLFAWIWPGSRAALLFTEAEVAWLFSAPLSRATLIQYKLLKSPIALLFTSVIFGLVGGRMSQGGAIWLRILGWWVILTIFQFHRLGASFALQRVRERGLGDARRRLILLAVAVAVGAMLYLLGRDAAAALRGHGALLGMVPDEISVDAVFERVRQGLFTPSARWLLAPFRLVIAPWFATTPLAFVEALGPALLILLLHYFWVIRADVSFEEASIALAQRRAAFVAARERGERSVRRLPKSGKQAVFALRPIGPPVIGVFWKSLLQAGGRRALKIWGIVILAVFIADAAVAAFVTSDPIRFIFLIVFGSILFVATLAASTQSSAHLQRSFELMDLLKSYPVRGRQMMAGELAVPLGFGLLVQWITLVLLGISGCNFPGGQMMSLHIAGFGVAAALLFPGFNLVSATLPCAAMLYLPAWFGGGRGATEARGLRILLLLGQLIAFVVALLPAGILGAGVWFAVMATGNPFAATITALLTAAVVLLLEGGAGLLLLGFLFDRFDVTED